MNSYYLTDASNLLLVVHSATNWLIFYQLPSYNNVRSAISKNTDNEFRERTDCRPWAWAIPSKDTRWSRRSRNLFTGELRRIRRSSGRMYWKRLVFVQFGGTYRCKLFIRTVQTQLWVEMVLVRQEIRLTLQEIFLSVIWRVSRVAAGHFRREDRRRNCGNLPRTTPQMVCFLFFF